MSTDNHTEEFVAVGLVLALLLAGYFFRGTNEQPAVAARDSDRLAGAVANGPAAPGSGLAVETITPGTGIEVKVGDTVAVNYTGTLIDGTTFDSSIPRGEPLTFTVGSGEVIPGWDLGIAGDGKGIHPMRVGEKRVLYIPPGLAYGETGTPGGPIPPNAPLIFEVELVSIGAR